MAEELEKALRRFRRTPAQEVNLNPTSPFEALLNQRIQHLGKQIQKLKGRVSGLLLAIMGAVVVQLVLGLLG